MRQVNDEAQVSEGEFAFQSHFAFVWFLSAAVSDVVNYARHSHQSMLSKYGCKFKIQTSKRALIFGSEQPLPQTLDEDHDAWR